MSVIWFDEIDASDGETAGGKGASLGALWSEELPIPPGFVVSAETFRSVLERTGVAEELDAALARATERPVEEVAQRAQEIVTGVDVPEDVRRDVLDAYDALADADAKARTDGEAPLVAVRSSATAEDLPDASFAGQQETFLNVDREAVVERVKECWASLYTPRALAYRTEQGFEHADVDIAVVVQTMVDAEKSGVLFTRDPTSGDPEMTVEATWGLGEAVVSGAVSPDNYVVSRDGDVRDVTVAEKKVMCVGAPDGAETVERPVPEARRTERVLDDADLDTLAALGRRVEAFYDAPQDVEWAIADGDVYLLQSRPITTIDQATGPTATAEQSAGGEAASDPETAADAEAISDSGGRASERGAGADAAAALRTDGSADGASTDRPDDGGSQGLGDDLVSGLGASPGRASGPARVVSDAAHLDDVDEGDVLVTTMTTPDMVPAMQRAAALVTDEGGMTSHAAIVSRELEVPAVTGTGSATETLTSGQVVTVDGERGAVREGAPVDAGADGDGSAAGSADDGRAGAGSGSAAAGADGTDASGGGRVDHATATRVKVNVSIPDAAGRAAATGADGVGLMRLEHAILSTGKTPRRHVEDAGADGYVRELVDEIRTVADAFYPRPVRVRTLDAPTDEFRSLDGGEDEPVEHNPMLGFRGARRSLAEPDLFELELSAFARLHEIGYDNVEVMFPLVTDAADVERLTGAMRDAGLDPSAVPWGVMVETPASALVIEDIVETGVDFVSFGTNDLTQYTLAVDRNNDRVADRFDETHPAVLELLESTIEVCREHDVRTSICGEAASRPPMIETLVEAGVDSLSANIDAVDDVRRTAKRVEQRLVLDAIR